MGCRVEKQGKVIPVWKLCMFVSAATLWRHGNNSEKLKQQKPEKQIVE